MLPGGGGGAGLPGRRGDRQHSALSPWSRLRRARLDCWSPQRLARRAPSSGDDRAEAPGGRPRRHPDRVGVPDSCSPRSIPSRRRGSPASTTRSSSGRYLRRRPTARRSTHARATDVDVPQRPGARGARGRCSTRSSEVTGGTAPGARRASAFLHAPALPGAHAALARRAAGRRGRAADPHRRAEQAYRAAAGRHAPGVPPRPRERNPVGRQVLDGRPDALRAAAPDALDPGAGSATRRPDACGTDPSRSRTATSRSATEVRDVQFRTLAPHPALRRSERRQRLALGLGAAAGLVGPFDRGAVHARVRRGPRRWRSTTYAPPALTGARRGGRATLLGGRGACCRPPNLGGYVAQPPPAADDARAAHALLLDRRASTSARTRTGRSRRSASARRRRATVPTRSAASGSGRWRERIAGAHGARCRRHRGRVAVAAGHRPARGASLGRPALALSEPWVRKGVAADGSCSAIDRKSLVAVRPDPRGVRAVRRQRGERRRAHAPLRARRARVPRLDAGRGCSASSWARWRLVGLAVAGVLGGLLALPVAAIAGVEASPARAALAVPAAVVLAALAGLLARRARRARASARGHAPARGRRSAARRRRRRLAGLARDQRAARAGARRARRAERRDRRLRAHAPARRDRGLRTTCSSARCSATPSRSTCAHDRPHRRRGDGAARGRRPSPTCSTSTSASARRSSPRCAPPGGTSGRSGG